MGSALLRFLGVKLALEDSLLDRFRSDPLESGDEVLCVSWDIVLMKR